MDTVLKIPAVQSKLNDYSILMCLIDHSTVGNVIANLSYLLCPVPETHLLDSFMCHYYMMRLSGDPGDAD